MKTIRLTCLGVTLRIYGKDEKKAYEKHSGNTVDDAYVGQVSRCYRAWIGDMDRMTCLHEVVHLVDFVIEDHLRITEGATETRAYLIEYLTPIVREYICGKGDAEREKDKKAVHSAGLYGRGSEEGGNLAGEGS